MQAAEVAVEQTPAQAAASAPATPAPAAVQVVSVAQETATPQQVYRAFKSARNILGDQHDEVESSIRDIREQLRQGNLNPVDQKGLEQRLVDANARLSAIDKQITAADGQVVQAASVPGATQEPPRPPRQGPPEEAFVLGGMLIFAVVLPLTIAYSRRIWRRAATAVPSIPKELYDRLTRLDQATESIAVEVERVGEAQRFMTSVMTDQNSNRALGAGPAERIDVREREKVGAKRAEF